MHLYPDNLSELADALERQVEVQAEAAKRAIREYKKTIIHETASGGKADTQRGVEQAVNQYIQLRKSLDELRAQLSASHLPPRAG